MKKIPDSAFITTSKAEAHLFSANPKDYILNVLSRAGEKRKPIVCFVREDLYNMAYDSRVFFSDLSSQQEIELCRKAEKVIRFKP